MVYGDLLLLMFHSMHPFHKGLGNPFTRTAHNIAAMYRAFLCSGFNISTFE